MSVQRLSTSRVIPGFIVTLLGPPSLTLDSCHIQNQNQKSFRAYLKSTGRIASRLSSPERTSCQLRSVSVLFGRGVGISKMHGRILNAPNQAMQPTAGRRTVSLHFMKNRPLQATTAVTSGG